MFYLNISAPDPAPSHNMIGPPGNRQAINLADKPTTARKMTGIISGIFLLYLMTCKNMKKLKRVPGCFNANRLSCGSFVFPRMPVSVYYSEIKEMSLGSTACMGKEAISILLKPFTNGYKRCHSKNWKDKILVIFYQSSARWYIYR